MSVRLFEIGIQPIAVPYVCLLYSSVIPITQTLSIAKPFSPQSVISVSYINQIFIDHRLCTSKKYKVESKKTSNYVLID